MYPALSLDPSTWLLEAHVTMRWSYVRADGQLAVENAPAAIEDRDEHVVTPLAVRWMGAWHVTVPPLYSPQDSLICMVANNALGTLFTSIRPPADLNDATWDTYATHEPASGCLIIIHEHVATRGTASDASIAVLYRCGVLLAADAAAAMLFPGLPAADATESALARQTAPPGSSL